jgi:hypothetical protein
MFRCLLWVFAAAIRTKMLLVADNLCLRQATAGGPAAPQAEEAETARQVAHAERRRGGGHVGGVPMTSGGQVYSYVNPPRSSNASRRPICTMGLLPRL